MTDLIERFEKLNIYKFKANRTCKWGDCTKNAEYGYANTTKRLCCKEHKNEEMINIARKLCEKCKNKIATYGVNKATHCKTCKTDEMVDVAHKKCKKKRPNFGLPGDKPNYCKDCKSEAMIDTNNKKCLVCKKVQPVFNHPQSTNASHCFTCKLPGMVDVLNKLKVFFLLFIIK